MVNNLLFHFAIEPRNLLVANQAIAADVRTQNNALERAATAQRHVHLPVREGLRRIDYHLVESQALALVDGNGPRQFERILSEGAVNHFGYLFCLTVNLIACILPFGWRHFNGRFAAAAIDVHNIILDVDNAPDFTVVEAFFGRRVVLDKHHLRPLFQLKFELGRVHLFGKITRYSCLITNEFAFKFLQLALVYLV